MFAGISAGGQLAFNCGLDQQVGIGHQRVHRVNAGVEIVFDLIEIAVVAVSDAGRNIAFCAYSSIILNGC